VFDGPFRKRELYELTRPMAKSWRRTKITARPRTQVGAKEGPSSGIRLLKMFELDLFPNIQYPETAAE